MEPVTKTRDSGKYTLVLRVMIANVDPGNKLRVEDSSYFKRNLLKIIMTYDFQNIVSCSWGCEMYLGIKLLYIK